MARAEWAVAEWNGVPLLHRPPPPPPTPAGVLGELSWAHEVRPPHPFPSLISGHSEVAGSSVLLTPTSLTVPGRDEALGKSSSAASSEAASAGRLQPLFPPANPTGKHLLGLVGVEALTHGALQVP